MANNLTINEGLTIVLDGNPPAEMAVNLQRIQINTLEDLVSNGIIESQSTLQELLNSAQVVTADALSNSETFTPFVRVPNSTRTDLRRFGSFIAATPDTLPSERQAFWRIARQIEPRLLSSLTSSQVLATSASNSRLSEIISYFFQNVTVEANAVLQINSAVQVFTCNELLVRRSGRIVVNGSNSLKINAFSIEAEQ